jgi:hypothetical protein
MPTKTKNRRPGRETTVSPVKHLLLHEVTDRTDWGFAASRRAVPLAAGAPNHARHHVSRQSQS